MGSSASHEAAATASPGDNLSLVSGTSGASTLTGSSSRASTSRSHKSRKKKACCVVSQNVITASQKDILRSTWQKLQREMERMGVVSFLRMFETHPETMQPFLLHIHSAQAAEMDEWYKEKLRVHSLRVMAVVEKTMNRLNREAKAAEILVMYGRRHLGYGVTPPMLDLMAESILVSIEQNLEHEWTGAVRGAWTSLMSFIVASLKEGYKEKPNLCQKEHLATCQGWTEDEEAK